MPVDHLIDAGGVLGGEPRLQTQPQAKADVGVLGGIFGGCIERHPVEADLLGADAAHRFIGDALMLEMGLG
jgi:hypothetical protein